MRYINLLTYLQLGLGYMASAVARAYNGGLERSPQRRQGAEPLVCPLKPKAFSLLASNGTAKLAPFQRFVVYVFSKDFCKTPFRSVSAFFAQQSAQFTVPIYFFKVFILLLPT